MFEILDAQLNRQKADGLQRVLKTVSSPCGPELVVDGKPLLAFASNDYLGLAAHPALTEALVRGAQQYGVGSGASHLVSGHYLVHAKLEQRLGSMLSGSIPNARALYFCDGYLANLGVLSGMASLVLKSQCTIFSESLNHASLIDGARLARVETLIYPHNDYAALERQLQASRSKLKLVVTDGVFSMDGDLAPLKQILALCQQYQAWLIVDDAHGFGVLGEDGAGILQQLGLRSSQLIYIGTLGKAAGVSGAFVCADPRVIEWLLQRARTYVYATASAPALAQALLASLDIINGEEGRALRAKLNHLIAMWRTGIRLQRWQLPDSPTAIQPLIIGSNREALRVGQRLRELGLWLPVIRPPTVPEGSARLRISLSAAHTEEQVQRLIDVIAQLESETAHD
jgi:8-amino-7-oxononanoate synthase